MNKLQYMYLVFCILHAIYCSIITSQRKLKLCGALFLPDGFFFVLLWHLFLNII